MAYISVNKDGSYIVSASYPYRIGKAEFRNDMFYASKGKLVNPFKPKDTILSESISEYHLEEGFIEIWDCGDDFVLGTIEVTKDMFSSWTGGRTNFKLETIKALGLENLTWEDEPVEI